MEESIKIEIERLINLKKTMKSDVKSMENIFNQYVGEKMTICTFCAAQIKMAQKRLFNWYKTKINQEIEITEVVIENKPKQGCQSCKSKRGRPKKS